MLQLARHANPEGAFLGVMKDHGAASRPPRGLAIDGAVLRAGAEDEACLFLEQHRAIRDYPLGAHSQLAAAGPAAHRGHRLVDDVAHLRFVRGGRGRRVAPEVEAVDVAEVEPVAHVMGMIGALAGPGLEREAARHDDAGCGADRKEHRLLERRRIEVGGEWPSGDQHIDAVRR